MAGDSDINPRYEWPDRLWFECFEPLYGYAMVEMHKLECDFQRLKSGDRFFVVQDFYPNGRFAKEDDMRHGRGSRFLENVIEAAKSKKCIKAVMGDVTKEGMKYMPKFLLKKGFEKIAENKFILYISND